MNNYLNNTTSGQYYYINGKYVLNTSKEANNVNFKSDNQYYAITNNFNYLPQPEIANAHQVSYQDQYKNNNYFSNNNNLYNINTNLNINNVINNSYDYKIKPNEVYMPQNNNSNNCQNNYALVTPINTIQNPFRSSNSTYIQHNTINIPIKNKQNILSNESNISNEKNEVKEKTYPYNIKGDYDPIKLDILNANKVVLNIIKKEESGDFLCPKCGHRLFSDNLGKDLEKWISRENNGINKIIFYGKDFMGYPIFYGKMEEKYYPEYNDSDDSCGVKRSIHFDAHTELQIKDNYSFEYCWKEAFTDKEWNKYLDNIMCLFCDYKSNFLDFIKDKKNQTKNK